MISGRSQPAAIARTTASVNAPAWPDEPTRIVGLNFSTTHNSCSFSPARPRSRASSTGQASSAL